MCSTLVINPRYVSTFNVHDVTHARLCRSVKGKVVPVLNE
jgi:hypothetical protein